FIASLMASAETSADQCARTRSMSIYSNAYIHEETGDLLGYELAVKQHRDGTVEALLYVYEGSAVGEGIDLPGHISGRHLTITGDWAERLVEYPSKKEIVQTHVVRIDGTLGQTSFFGNIKIADLDEGKIKLKRVNNIWTCKP
ncbi:MAG: hypothetical protein WBX02_11175, partial [Terriglobales bacterium]